MKKNDKFILDKYIVDRIITKILFGLLVIAGILEITAIINSNSMKKVNIDKNWEVICNKKISTKVELNKFNLDMVNKNDSVILKKTLEKADIDEPALLLEVYHAMITVKIDGEEIYGFGKDANENNKTVGSGKFVVSLPKDYVGKELEIRYDITEDNAFPKLESIYMIDENEYAKSIFSEEFLEILTAAMIVVLGIVAIITVFIISNYSEYNRRILWIGILFVLIGLWIFARYNILSLFVQNKTVISYIEYGSLYLCVPTIGLMFFELQKKNFARKLLMIMIIISGTIAVLSILLEAINVVHMVSFLTFMQFLGVCIIGFSLVIMFMEFKQKSRSERMLIHACAILIVAVVLELIRFNLVKYLFGENEGKSYIVVAVFIFVIIIIISYFMYSKEYIDLSVEKRALVDMAYKDILTGLASRSAVMETIEELKNNNAKEYTIFNFDLNDLKKVNDKQGHLAGDKYLCIFSYILQEFLSECEVIGRVGGDEFIAILNKKSNENEIERKFKKMESVLAEKSMQSFNVSTSFAYGYSISCNEHVYDVMEAYDKADEKMYECKQKQKDMVK